MVQLGANHSMTDIQGSFVQIVDTLDLVKGRLEAVQQWAQTQTAAGLATAWSIPTADAQAYLDVCASFGNLINNALTADPKLAGYVAQIRNVGR